MKPSTTCSNALGFNAEEALIYSTEEFSIDELALHFDVALEVVVKFFVELIL